MLPDFSSRLAGLAEVLVRIGLNLRPGQRILVAEPYELQGVARSAEVIVHAVHAAALRHGAPEMPVDVIWGDPARLRAAVEGRDWRELGRRVEANTRRLHAAIEAGDAILILQGSHPRLLAGVPAAAVADAHRVVWEHFGPVAQQLTAGATNWTGAPAPSPAWAAAAFEFLPEERRLTALWTTVFSAFRCAPAPGGPDAVAAWTAHLAALAARRDALNAARPTRLRYRGEDTDLTVTLPREHVWCTAQLRTPAGAPFVANLPTEEVFTAPAADSAAGTLRVSRPVLHGGGMIDGIELEFARGEVVAARARTGADLLARLLDTDDGARRLGEVALLPETPAWAGAAPLFRHVLLDENAAPHVALGEAYAFCAPGSRRPPNRSLLHLDLPVAAEAELT